MSCRLPARPDEHLTAVVIGGGQAGLATSHALDRQGVDHVVLDAHERVGDAWRRRWDTLELFTPAWLDALPGLEFPGPAWQTPTKDAMADYLEAYAAHFELPVRTGVHVDRVSPGHEGFVVRHELGSVRADHVVVASGGQHHPRIPAFAGDLDDEILQLHAKDYRRPDQLRPGGVLVVGAGSSGAEIALDVVDEHRTWLSGRDPGHEPTRPGTWPDRLVTPLVWLVASRVLTVGTPWGRRVRDRFTDPPRGIPRGRIRERDLAEAGVVRLPRTVAVRDGTPVMADGRGPDVANVVWCTGFRHDFGWIDAPIFDDLGRPAHRRGVVPAVPGLYFVGLPFQHSLASSLVGGVGRDARFVVDHLVAGLGSTEAPNDRWPRPFAGRGHRRFHGRRTGASARSGVMAGRGPGP